MNLDISMQSLKNLFSFPFHDPKWQGKFLTGSGLLFAGMIIPLLPWLPVLGYAARLMRAGARNEDPSRLPGWDDWTELFTDGLRQFGTSIILTFPGSVILVGGWALYMLTVITGIAVSQSRGDYSPGLGMLIGMTILFTSMGIGMLLSTIGLLLYPAAAGHVAAQRRFGAFFQVGQWWKVLRANLGGFLLTLFIMTALYFVMLTVMQMMYMTLILCALIPFALSPIGFYIVVIYARLTGQAYGDGAAKAGIPLASDPLPAPEIQDAPALS